MSARSPLRPLAFATLMLLVACSRTPVGPGHFNGYAEADYTRVAAPSAGQLVRVAVQRGAEVAQGALLFTLDPQPERAAVREAQAREQRSQALARDLTKGQRRDELAAARAALDAGGAALADSQQALQRQRALAEQGFVASATLQTLQARRDADAARVRQLQAQLRVAEQGGRTDQLAAARADAAAASAVVAQAQWQLQQRVAEAPVAARVEDVLFRPGEWVSAGAPVVTLLAPGAIKLRFFVPEPQLAAVKLGDKLSVACDGCGAPITATVSYVSPQAEFTPPVIYNKDNRARLVFLVEARPALQDARKLHPGQPVDVSLQSHGG